MTRYLHHVIAASSIPRYSLRLDKINYGAALSHWLHSHGMKAFAARRMYLTNSYDPTPGTIAIADQ